MPARVSSRSRGAPVLALAWSLLLACTAAAAEEPHALSFKRDGETVATRDLAWLRATLPSRSVRVHEPYEEREVRFEAFPFDALLDAVYSPAWREQGEQLLVLLCRDRYQPTLPVARVLRHRAWLAFDRPGGDGFSILKLESGRLQRVELAPFYLIWENLEDAQVRLEGDYGWPYQLVSIDLVRAEDRFPRMTPPPDAPAQVRAGFAAFQVHCSRCHPVNGEGGAVGPELNGPARPVEYREREWLRRWIDDPSQLFPQARMPPLNPAEPDREATIARIIAYLQAMSAAGHETPHAP